MGSDALRIYKKIPGKVSIHAPVWGATTLQGMMAKSHMSFNPRSRMGSDPVSQFPFVTPVLFQSTLPYGERRRLSKSAWLEKIVSIHAPVWGATDKRRYVLDTVRGFNPRSRMGSDFPFCNPSPYPSVSIHAPVWGATAITYNFFTIFRDCLCNYNNIIVLIQAY